MTAVKNNELYELFDRYRERFGESFPSMQFADDIPLLKEKIQECLKSGKPFDDESVTSPKIKDGAFAPVY